MAWMSEVIDEAPRGAGVISISESLVGVGREKSQACSYCGDCHEMNSATDLKVS